MKRAVILLSFIMLICACKTQKATALSFNSTIPYFTLVSLETRTTFKNNDVQFPCLFVYFNTECEYSQKQAKIISENAEIFNTYNIYFVSYEEPELIIDFKNKENLTQENFTFLLDARLTFANKFKLNTYPSVLIYDQKKSLKNAFSGITSINKLSKAL